MTQIVLTADQTALLASSDEPVAICRPDGSIVGVVSPKTRIFAPDNCPFTPEEVATAEREAATTKRWFTTQEVLQHLQSLDR